MEQLVILTRERHWENAKWSDLFLVSNSDNPEQTFRKAVKEYLLTEQGRNAIKQTSEDFNWGDAVTYVPELIWNKYGITSINEGDGVTLSNPIAVTVEQDEILIPQEYYDSEEE